MPSTIGEAFVAIRPDTAGFATQATEGIKPGLAQMAGLIAGTFAAAKVKDFFKDSFSEAQEAQKVGAQTTSVIKSQGNAANVTAAQVANLAQSLSRKAGIDDEVIQSGENMLLTFGRVRNEAGKGNDIFNQATKATLDMAVAFSKANGGEIDLQGASIQLGKALNDPIEGVTALQRVGVRLTEQQKDQVKAFVESGDTLSAQKVILAEVTREFGGSAAAQATAADKAAVAWGNLQEAIGLALLPAINAVLDVATPVLGFLAEHKGAAVALAVVVGGILTAAFYAWASSVVAAGAAGLADLFLQAAYGAGFLFGKLQLVGQAMTAIATNPWLAAAAIIIGAAVAIASAKEGESVAWKRAEDAGRSWAQTIAAGAKASISPITTLRAQLDQLEASIRERLSTGEISIEQAARYKGMLDGLNGEIGRTKQANREANAVEQQRTTQLSLLAQGILGVGNASDDTKAAIEQMTNAVLAATGGDIAYRAALAQREEAQQALNEAILFHGDASEEAAAAQRNLDAAQQGVANAAISQTAATEKLRQEIKDTVGGADAMIATLEEEKRLHPEAAAAIDIQIGKVREIAFQNLVAAQTARDNPIRVRSDTSEAVGPLAALYAQIAALPREVAINVRADVASSISSGIFGDGRASGGPVWPGWTGWVGEQGPELLSIGAGGQGWVTNARDSAAASRGGSPGGLFAGATVQFYDNPIPQLDYYAITRAGN